MSAVLSKVGLILDCNILPSEGLSILVSEIKRSDNSPYIAADMLSFNLISLYVFVPMRLRVIGGGKKMILLK